MTIDPAFKGYKTLIVWRKADELAFMVYKATKNFPREEIFGLTSQMRRSAVSVPANIVEGYARISKNEKIHFYNIARASLAELEYYLDFSLKLGYVKEEEHARLVVLREEVGKLLTGFMKSTKSS